MYTSGELPRHGEKPLLSRGQARLHPAHDRGASSSQTRKSVSCTGNGICKAAQGQMSRCPSRQHTPSLLEPRGRRAALLRGKGRSPRLGLRGKARFLPQEDALPTRLVLRLWRKPLETSPPRESDGSAAHHLAGSPGAARQPYRKRGARENWKEPRECGGGGADVPRGVRGARRTRPQTRGRLCSLRLPEAPGLQDSEGIVFLAHFLLRWPLLFPGVRWRTELRKGASFLENSPHSVLGQVLGPA